ncbi:MAG TPA: preprotein translocase subunit SecA [bacterium]|nr:preprotein translocase subunit SecA [bacterium]
MGLMQWLVKVFGSKTERDIKRLQPYAELTNALEPLLTVRPDAELLQRTANLRAAIGRALAAPAEFNARAYAEQLTAERAAALAEWRRPDAAAAGARWLADRLRQQQQAYAAAFKEDAFSAVLLGSFREDRIARAADDFVPRAAAWSGADQLDDASFRQLLLDLGHAEGDREDPLALFLPEAFALARAAAQRVVNMRHFDVQVIGGTVLHQGRIAEMKTGEGKTLVAVLPAFLNALTGNGVHLVTVNDYLARRDAMWMGQIHAFLGLSVGVLQHAVSYRLQATAPGAVAIPEQVHRRDAYYADLTYGTNNEYGFDYLRDNMAVALDYCVQRANYSYAIVDEVDSILVDEARTPLIISGPSEDNPERYTEADRIARALAPGDDFEVDEKEHTVNITDQGIRTIEGMLHLTNLYDTQHMDRIHDYIQALRAHKLYQRDVEYIVKDGKVVIVDEFTGRLMPGRRFSDGLHQALEAKERVVVESENQTLATITLQNYFRMYDKLAGMTGTADTEAVEFREIYKLDVTIIPPNMPMVRRDLDDAIYRSAREKVNAIVARVKEIHATGAPVLVGTISIEMSELLGKKLRETNVQHNILNAKYHEREAEIIARAGQRGAVTIATNMAGRGTDIVLGEGVQELGGLHILGTERHESRRIDNQLRGRAGRQGDPGQSQFFVSLEDDLMRLFGSDRVAGFMTRLGVEEGEVISHPFISRALERAQRKVEERNFDIRKNLIKFDDTMNEQRSIVYRERRQALERAEIGEVIDGFLDDEVQDLLAYYCPPDKHSDDWDWDGLNRGLKASFSLPPVPRDSGPQESPADLVAHTVRTAYAAHRARFGAARASYLEKMVLLHTVDERWKEHLLGMDHLREGIHLRGYGQRDPFVEYKNESARLFNAMIEGIRRQVLSTLFRVEVVSEAPAMAQPERRMSFERGPLRGFAPPPPGEQPDAAAAPAAEDRPKLAPQRRALPKVGRNDLCPCGSGKKFKHCHGRI